jgi:hypothetical protein
LPLVVARGESIAGDEVIMSILPGGPALVMAPKWLDQHSRP